MRSNRIAFAGLVLLMSGCALIKQGTSQKVTFESTPTRAEIWLNNEKHPELTPATIELPKGEYVYEIRKAGFIPKQGTLKCRTCSYFYWSLLMGFLAAGVDWFSGAWKEFDIPEDDKDTIRAHLSPNLENSEHIVYFTSNPPGASIIIEGIEIQEKAGTLGKDAQGKDLGSPVNVQWKDPADRTRKVEMVAIGYKRKETRLQRGTARIHLDLLPNDIEQRLEFTSEPAGAEILLDGVSKGATPRTVVMTRAKGDTKPMTVEFRKPGYVTQTRTIPDQFDKTIPVKLEAIVDSSILKIDCIPAGSVMELDGAKLGAAPPEIKLDWSVNQKSHVLKFSRPGYESHEITVEDTQRATPVTVRLRPSLPRLP